jgi:hypothetical protein
MELLIHISAPTSKKDDDRYRAQAQAYLNFEPAVTHVCEPLLPNSGENEIPLALVQQTFGILGEQQVPNKSSSASSMITLDKHALSSSERPPQTPSRSQESPDVLTRLQKLESIQKLWKSRQKAASNPRMRPNAGLTDSQCLFSTQCAIAALETQLCSNSSSSNSTNISSPLGERASKRRRITSDDLFPARSSSNTNSAIPSVIFASLTDSRVVENEPVRHTPDRAELLSSQLPETYDLSKSDESSVPRTPIAKGQSITGSVCSEKTPKNRTRNERTISSAATARSKSFEVYRSAVDDKTLSTIRTWSSQPPPINFGKENVGVVPLPKLTEHPPTGHSPDLASKSKQRSFPQPKPTPSPATPVSLLQHLHALPKQILPPHAPKADVPISEATFLNGALQGLTKHQELLKIWHKKRHQSRGVSKFERGYWRFDARNWPLRHQIKFWRDLMRFVENGTVGLGTSCFREAGEKETSLGIVKVFCWGEIVMHVYLFLYTIMRHEMRVQTAAWVDVDGLTVVSIP